MEKFVLKEILTPKFQLIVPNSMYANDCDIVQAINSFIENTTKQSGKFVSKDLEITNPNGWNVVIKDCKNYSTITLEKVELIITPFGSDNDR
jgi:hypothetical protein